MTINDLKLVLKKTDARIAFGVVGTDLILAFEDVLLTNGWKWRCFADEDGTQSFIKFRADDYKRIIFYSNYNGNEYRILSMNSCADDFHLATADITVTWDFISEFNKILHPVPDYKPRKIIKEV